MENFKRLKSEIFPKKFFGLYLTLGLNFSLVPLQKRNEGYWWKKLKEVDDLPAKVIPSGEIIVDSFLLWHNSGYYLFFSRGEHFPSFRLSPRYSLFPLPLSPTRRNCRTPYCQAKGSGLKSSRRSKMLPPLLKIFVVLQTREQKETCAEFSPWRNTFGCGRG